MAEFVSTHSKYILRAMIHLKTEHHISFASLVELHFPSVYWKTSVIPDQLIIWITATKEIDFIRRISVISGLPTVQVEHLLNSVIIIHSEYFANPVIYNILFEHLCKNTILHRFLNGLHDLCIYHTDDIPDVETLLKTMPISYQISSTGFRNAIFDLESFVDASEGTILVRTYMERLIDEIQFDDTKYKILWKKCPYIFKLYAQLSKRDFANFGKFCDKYHQSIELKKTVVDGEDYTDIWITDVDELFCVKKILKDKGIIAAIGNIPFHFLLMEFDYIGQDARCLIKNFLYNRVRFSLMRDKSTIILGTATDYFTVKEIIDECGMIVRLYSIEIPDIRCQYEHSFPECNVDYDQLYGNNRADTVYDY